MKSCFLGPLEHEVMEFVWSAREVTVKQVLEKLCCDRYLAYTTVQTVLERLNKKGLLLREKRGKQYLYTYVKSRGDTLKLIAITVVDDLVQRFGYECLKYLKVELENRLKVYDDEKVGS